MSAILPRCKGSTSIPAVSWEHIPPFAFRSIPTKSSTAISVTAKQEGSSARARKPSYRTPAPVYGELDVNTSSLPIYTSECIDAHRAQSYFDLHRLPSLHLFCTRSFLWEYPLLSEFSFSSSSSSSNSTLSIFSSTKGYVSDAMVKQIIVTTRRMAVILFILFYVL